MYNRIYIILTVVYIFYKVSRVIRVENLNVSLSLTLGKNEKMKHHINLL